MPMFAIPLMQRQYGPERKMDRWVAETNASGLIMGYYGREANPVQWKLAEEFVLFDRWFQAIHGSSNTNHYYLVSARTTVYPNAPKELPEEVVDKHGNIIEWRFGLEPLAERDRNARAPLEAFDFQQPPRQPVPLP